MPFSSLGLSPALCTPLARLGYSRPTPVQSESIPLVLDGRDMLARAQTGTGKTAAFGLPMIDRLLLRHPRRAQTRQPRGLILVPTRELALQVHKAIATYGAPARLRTTAIFGGVAPRHRHRRSDAGPPHRSHAAAHRRFVGSRDPHAGRGRSDARHGLPAGAPPRARGVATGATDTAVLGDALE